MNYSVTWTQEALITFEDRIDYLKIHWTEKEIRSFKKRVREYLETLKKNPLIGKNPGKLNNVFMGLIIKQVSIIYRVNADIREIQLISFVDNRQNPDKISKHIA